MSGDDEEETEELKDYSKGPNYASDTKRDAGIESGARPDSDRVGLTRDDDGNSGAVEPPETASEAP